MTADEFAAFVLSAIKQVVAPMAARLAALEDGAPVRDLGTLRERIAIIETKGAAPGPPGQDGADGLGFDDLVVEHDGERGLVFKLTRGDRVREVGHVTMPIPIYRGVYALGKSYDGGDVVTYGGSSWHCLKTTTTRPDSTEGAGYWRLMVKRGDRGKVADYKSGNG